jgi:hypothetical protein
MTPLAECHQRQVRARCRGLRARADKWEGQARTKQLPSTRTKIGAGGELIDIENRWDAVGVVDTVADPDYVTASASRERLELANEARSLDLALDVADSIQAQDSLEKMLVHEMAVLHRGMMRAATRSLICSNSKIRPTTWPPHSAAQRRAERK